MWLFLVKATYTIQIMVKYLLKYEWTERNGIPTYDRLYHIQHRIKNEQFQSFELKPTTSDWIHSNKMEHTLN